VGAAWTEVNVDMIWSRSNADTSATTQYIAVTLGGAREATSSIPKTLNPEWNQTFELPVEGIDGLLLEAVCWDKDRFKKDYMGEFDIPLEDIFANGQTIQEVGLTLHNTWGRFG